MKANAWIAACARLLCAVLPILSVASCEHRASPGAQTELLVAAASNLSDAFEEISREYQRTGRVKITMAYGATGNLARQIETGAPFDLFAAADVEHVRDLAAKRLVDAESIRVYARGRLVLFWVDGSDLTGVEELTSAQIKRIALPRPDLAPYGAAAEEALRHAGLLESVRAKILLAENVSHAKQLTSSGNADAAFIPLSLVRAGDRYVEVSQTLYPPIDQAIGIVEASKSKEAARAFISFLTGPEGNAILTRHGY